MSYNFKDSISSAEKNYDMGGGRFKFQEGITKVRILDSSKEPLATHFIPDGNKTRAVVCVGKKNGCEYHDAGAPKDKDGRVKRPSVKYVMYILVRPQDDVVLVEMPYSVVKALSELQANPDWAFDNLPMPYDIAIKYTKDAAPNDMYVVTPTPTKAALSKDVLTELAGLKETRSCDSIVAERIAKQSGKTVLAKPKAKGTQIDAEPEGELPDLEEGEIDPKSLPF